MSRRALGGTVGCDAAVVLPAAGAAGAAAGVAVAAGTGLATAVAAMLLPASYSRRCFCSETELHERDEGFANSQTKLKVT